jgi:hypothetical protein
MQNNFLTTTTLTVEVAGRSVGALLSLFIYPLYRKLFHMGRRVPGFVEPNLWEFQCLSDHGNREAGTTRKISFHKSVFHKISGILKRGDGS